MDMEHYKKELLNSNNTYDNINKYLAPYLPGKLYKYSNFKSKYWEDLIFKGQIYLAKASSLNDPFDCLIHCDIEELYRYYKKSMISRFPILNDSNFQNYAYELKQYIIDGMQEDVRTTCFSEVWDSILMWSHYSDCHKGFCIEYDTGRLNDLKKGKLFAALYQKNQIDITKDILNLSPNAGLISMVGKAEEWKYEKEWRIITLKKSQDYLYFRKEISSIILGLKCEDINKDKVCKWASKNNKKVFQTEIVPGKYEIKKKRLI